MKNRCGLLCSQQLYEFNVKKKHRKSDNLEYFGLQKHAVKFKSHEKSNDIQKY